jgi:limonene-1,2-epoxide hydrolase
VNSAAETIAAFVEAFIAAWPTGDAERLGEFFSHDAVYHNGPLPPVKGRTAIVANLAGFMALGGQVDVDMVHIVADGPIVMTERVDHFVGADGKLSLPVMGTFEVHDGVITSWRDYFDLSQFTSQLPATD